MSFFAIIKQGCFIIAEQCDCTVTRTKFYKEVLKQRKIFETLWNHCHKKGKDSLEIQAKLALLCVYVENQAILELILLYRTSKCKQTYKQGERTVYGPTSLRSRCGHARIKLNHNSLRFVAETLINNISHTKLRF